MDAAELKKTLDKFNEERRPGEAEFTMRELDFDMEPEEWLETLASFQREHGLDLFDWRMIPVTFVFADEDPRTDMRPSLVSKTLFPGLAIVKHAGGAYTVTHMKSGYAVSAELQLPEALSLAVKVGRWTDWTKHEEDIRALMAPDQQKFMRRYRELYEGVLERTDD